VIRTAKEMGIKTVAVYSMADHNAVRTSQVFRSKYKFLEVMETMNFMFQKGNFNMHMGVHVSKNTAVRPQSVS
jgi:biotin carboxylase